MGEEEEKYVVKVFNPTDEIRKLLYEIGREVPLDVVEVISEKEQVEKPKLCIESPCGKAEVEDHEISPDVIKRCIESIKCPVETKEEPKEEPTPVETEKEE